MQYITHRRFKGLALCGQRLNIPYGTVLETNDEYLELPDGRQVCATRSDTGTRYFARNDDRNGPERGALTWAIAYEDRVAPPTPGSAALTRPAEDDGHRLNQWERDYLADYWSEYLVPDVDVILFNDAFFAAPIEDLRSIAHDIGIKPKTRR